MGVFSSSSEEVPADLADCPRWKGLEIAFHILQRINFSRSPKVQGIRHCRILVVLDYQGARLRILLRTLRFRGWRRLGWWNDRVLKWWQILCSSLFAKVKKDRVKNSEVHQRRRRMEVGAIKTNWADKRQLVGGRWVLQKFILVQQR